MELIFNISLKNPASHYIHVKLELQNVNQKQLTLLLPRWRPGRYELGNFSKNIQNFQATDSSGKKLLVIKPNTHSWEIFNDNGDNKILVEYNYYANEYNAGACFADENILYFNPIHLLMNVASVDTRPTFKIHIGVPNEYKIITSLKVKNKTIESKNYDELVDSPIVATKHVKTFSYKIDEIKFFVHTISIHEQYLNVDKVKKDFEQFSARIMKFWGTAPFREYHFIIHLLPYQFYHGVEHLKNSVIVLGPYHQIMTKLYNELLGIASHELFHAWNIKTLRPKQMYPYNYYTENYSELGFVYEGFTTYYGDKLLWQSDVFNDHQFFDCINERLNRHFINYGKFSQSLLNSSIDTWVDGYNNYAPHKKVSIYDEGCILSMMMDLYILQKTNKRKSLRDVLLKLYDHQINQHQSYTLQDLIKAFVEFTKEENDMIFFDKTLLFPNDYLPLFEKIISHFGLITHYTESSNFWEKFFGFKISELNGKYLVSHIIPDSPAFFKLSLNDEILAINQYPAKDVFSEKRNTFTKQIELTIQRFQRIQNLVITADKIKTYYQTFSIQMKNKLSKKEKDLFIHYKKI